MTNTRLTIVLVISLTHPILHSSCLVMTNTWLTSTHLSPIRPTIPLWIVVICAGRIGDRYDRFFSFLWTLISWLSPRNVFKWEKDTAHARRNLPLLSKAMTMWTAMLGSHSQLVVSTIFSRRATGFSFPVGCVHRLLKKGNRFPFPVSRVHHLLKKGNHAQYVSACAPGQYYLACIFPLVKFKFYFD